MPVYRRSSDGLLAMAFTGRPRELSFVAPLTAGKNATGLAVFTLKPEASGDGEDAPPKGVALSWQIFRADTSPDHPAPPVHTRELLASSEGFAFRYRGRKAAAEPKAFGGEEAEATLAPSLESGAPSGRIASNCRVKSKSPTRA